MNIVNEINMNFTAQVSYTDAEISNIIMLGIKSNAKRFPWKSMSITKVNKLSFCHPDGFMISVDMKIGEFKTILPVLVTHIELEELLVVGITLHNGYSVPEVIAAKITTMIPLCIVEVTFKRRSI